MFTIEEIEAAIYDSEGYCSHCKEFTGDCIEPDACGYVCGSCGQNAVYGAEEALMMGLLAICEEE